MPKNLTIFKLFGDTHDLEDYLKAKGLWYAPQFRCWCTLCSLEDAHQLLDEIPGRSGLKDHSVLVTEEDGQLIVTVLLEH